MSMMSWTLNDKKEHFLLLELAITKHKRGKKTGGTFRNEQ